jgi:hypothetical protein
MEPAYNKLRPLTEIESCECETVNGILLVDSFSDNPINCDFCGKEVDPERIHLTAKETDAVVDWFAQEQALFGLWMNSCEYEDYAKSKLLDMSGDVNRNGLAAAELLSKRIPTRVWLFHDAEDGELTSCPVCGEPLDLDVKWGTGSCRMCRIQV